MDIIISDTTFNPIGILDTYKSFIWTERYMECGDFEIYVPFSIQHLSLLQRDYYISIKDSDYMMIIESVQISSDAEYGAVLIVTGRSLESLLSRRIVWTQTILTGNLQNGIKRLLSENIISPSDESRKFKMEFRETADERITVLEMDTQFFGENLYDIICDLCIENSIGFRVLYDGVDGFIFELFKGEDRTYEQSKNPYVIFSPNFDNLLSSNYYESSTNYKTVALVAGEGEGSDRKTVIAYLAETGTGLNRRELFVDASSTSSTVSDGSMSDSEYKQQLMSKGVEELVYSQVTTSFEGEIDATNQFRYGVDFHIGDVVQIRNEYGVESTVMVTELVRAHDESGLSVVPTFISIA